MNTLVSAVIFVAVVVTAQGAGRKVPLARVGSKTFYTIEGKEHVTWDEAVEVCSEAGLTTGVINNKAESDALGAAVKKLADQGKDNYYLWLGANLKNGKWIWAANGKELTYTNWSPSAELNLPATSPTDGYECGYISVNTWGTWTCSVEYAIPVCQSKQA